jgi:hypothetical protein
MSSAGAGNIFRYNISQNDGNGEETFFVMNDRTKIYNNTIYVGDGVNLEYFINDRNIDNMFFKNNILYVEGTIKNYSRNTGSYNAPNMANNLIYPASIMELPGSPNPYPGLLTENPMLVDPSAKSEIMDTWKQSIWDKNISNFKLGNDSPAVDAGTNIENPGTHDIYGTTLYVGDRADIGAHEYIETIAPSPEITITDPLTIYQSDKAEMNINVKDNGGGIENITVTLDGKSIDNPFIIEPLSLAIGKHTIGVTVVDRKGNETAKEFTLTITIDTDHLDDVIRVAGEKGLISNKGIQQSLLSSISNLKVLEKKVRTQTDKHIDEEFAKLLLSDIDYLKEQD